MKKVTVYGSLLEGLSNWHYHLDNEESTKLGEHILEDNLVMVSFGGFPGLVVDNNVKNNIFVETYEVTDKVYKSIERLEGYPHFYDRRSIQTPFGDSEIYVLAHAGNYEEKTLVPKDENGVINWRKYRMR
jgi:gamma-glutamylcyclotransferase (GGCT)/AIG2-like uncharacterized protein YtfP